MLPVMGFSPNEGYFSSIYHMPTERKRHKGSLSFGSYELKPLGSSSLMNFDELGTWSSGAKAIFSCCGHDFHGV